MINLNNLIKVSQVKSSFPDLIEIEAKLIFGHTTVLNKNFLPTDEEIECAKHQCKKGLLYFITSRMYEDLATKLHNIEYKLMKLVHTSPDNEVMKEFSDIIKFVEGKSNE